MERKREMIVGVTGGGRGVRSGQIGVKGAKGYNML